MGELRLSYALSKQIPDIEERGCEIHTSYGDLELSDADARAVARLLQKRFERRLARHRRNCPEDGQDHQEDQPEGTH